MPKKKEKVCKTNFDDSLPPYPFRVWTTKNKSQILYGFGEQHIRDMMSPVKTIKIKRIKEKKEKDIELEPMGPPGADIGRPAEYEPAFKILKAWVDSVGGPPEDVRKAIRVHWINYEKVKRKK